MGYFLELTLNILKNYMSNDLPFLLEHENWKKMKNLYIQRKLKQTLYHGLELKNVNRVIKFNQEVWLKSYIDKNTMLRKKQIMISKRKLQGHEQCTFWKNYEKCKKTEISSLQQLNKRKPQIIMN